MQALSDFVKERGLEMNPDTWSIRRPRTCIISTSREADSEYLDCMFVLQDGRLSLADPMDEVSDSSEGGTGKEGERAGEILSS